MEKTSPLAEIVRFFKSKLFINAVFTFFISIITVLLAFKLNSGKAETLEAKETKRVEKVEAKEAVKDEKQEMRFYVDAADKTILDNIKYIVQQHQIQENVYLQSLEKKIDKIDNKLDNLIFKTAKKETLYLEKLDTILCDKNKTKWLGQSK